MFSKVFHPSAHFLTEEEFFKLPQESVLVIDVRTPFEFAGDHLEIAQNIPYENIMSDRHHLPKDKIIVCYCNHGNRAGNSAEHLSQKGYQAYVVSGMAHFSDSFIKKCKKQVENHE